VNPVSLPLLLSAKSQPARTRRLFLPKTTTDQLTAYAHWIRTFDQPPHEDIVSSVVSVSLADLLAADFLWQTNKTPPYPPDESADYTTGHFEVLPEQTGSGGAPTNDSQRAPLAFIPPEPLIPHQVEIPDAISREFDAYVAWLHASHQLDRGLLLVCTVDRSIRAFLRRHWFRRTPHPHPLTR